MGYVFWYFVLLSGKNWLWESLFKIERIIFKFYTLKSISIGGVKKSYYYFYNTKKYVAMVEGKPKKLAFKL